MLSSISILKKVVRKKNIKVWGSIILGIGLLAYFTSNKRKLDGLHPVLRAKASRMLQELKEQKIKVIIYSAFRTMKEQTDIYAIGRTKPGKKVTNAKAGQSWHNYGLAFDVAPTINGKIVWEVPYWQQIGAAGKKQGLLWGGDFKSFKDRPHFEYHPGLTIDMAKIKFDKNEGLLA